MREPPHDFHAPVGRKVNRARNATFRFLTRYHGSAFIQLKMPGFQPSDLTRPAPGIVGDDEQFSECPLRKGQHFFALHWRDDFRSSFRLGLLHSFDRVLIERKILDGPIESTGQCRDGVSLCRGVPLGPLAEPVRDVRRREGGDFHAPVDIHEVLKKVAIAIGSAGCSVLLAPDEKLVEKGHDRVVAIDGLIAAE